MCDIDVTECRYYNCGECFAEPKTDYCGEIHGYNKCDKYEDCYYRKRQQTVQKLEEVQELLNDTDSIVQDYETPYDLAKEILQIIEE